MSFINQLYTIFVPDNVDEALADERWRAIN
jgi:hypothetical protein